MWFSIVFFVQSAALYFFTGDFVWLPFVVGGALMILTNYGSTED